MAREGYFPEAFLRRVRLSTSETPRAQASLSVSGAHFRLEAGESTEMAACMLHSKNPHMFLDLSDIRPVHSSPIIHKGCTETQREGGRSHHHHRLQSLTRNRNQQSNREKQWLSLVPHWQVYATLTPGAFSRSFD